MIMGKYWLLIVILLSVAFLRFDQKSEDNFVESERLAVNQNLQIKNYPEFSKSVQYFDTDVGRVVIARWPKFEKGDLVKVTGNYLPERQAVWFPDVQLVEKSSGFQGVVNDIRSLAEVKINSVFKHQASELMLGMLIGLNDLSPRLSENLKSAGIIHVVVVSGQNLALVFSFLAVGAKYFRRKLFVLISILIISGYVVVVGFEAPVVRAYIMILVALSAEVFGRKYSSVQALILAGLLMLVYNPSYLTEISFQLSFLASVGVLIGLAVTRRLNMGHKRFFGYVVEVYITSFFAWMTTIPVIIMSFGSVSVVAPIVNLVLLWLVPVFMVMGAIVSVLPSNWWVVNVLSYPVQILIDVFVRIINFFADINQNIFEPKVGISIYIVIFSYILILICLKIMINKK